MLHQCLTRILDEALNDPEKPLAEVGILPRTLRDQVLYAFNQTETPLPPVDLYEKFSAAAQAHPTRSALIFAGSRTDYQTLERQAAQVAAVLENALDGQKREKEPPLAAVLLPRTPQLYAAMLGAMRAGVPYLLLSCDLPAGRIRQILSQSGAQAVLSTPQILARLGVDPAPIACVDMETVPFPSSLFSSMTPW